ncbi:MAG TPA: hypothetical protein PK657_06475 [Legionella sp.]|nr:hypothetical protein [Legionella sp.]
MFFPSLSLEINNLINASFTHEEFDRIKSVSKLWYQNIWRRFGAEDHQDFLWRLNKIPYEIKELGFACNYSISYMEELANFVTLTPNECQKKLMLPEEWGTLNPKEWNEYLTVYGSIVLYRQLIPLEDLLRLIKDGGKVVVKNVIITLEKGWFTWQELKKLPNEYITYVLSNKALSALKQNLITPAQILLFKDIWFLKCLFELENGLNVLREGLLTAQQIIDLPDAEYLYDILSSEGVTALRQKLITPQQVALLKKNFAHYLFGMGNGKGIALLEKNPGIIEEIVNMPNLDTLMSRANL